MHVDWLGEQAKAQGVLHVASSLAVFSVLLFVARMGTKKKKRSKRISSGRVSLSKEPSINLFEVRVNRKKHDILGQRLKSDRGLPGISRSKAIQKVCHLVFVNQQIVYTRCTHSVLIKVTGESSIEIFATKNEAVYISPRVHVSNKLTRVKYSYWNAITTI